MNERLCLPPHAGYFVQDPYAGRLVSYNPVGHILEVVDTFREVDGRPWVVDVDGFWQKLRTAARVVNDPTMPIHPGPIYPTIIWGSVPTVPQEQLPSRPRL